MASEIVVKVTALVTRPAVDSSRELLVFDHPHVGTQLPAGTAEAGEDPVAAARRELFEETGVEGVDRGRVLWSGREPNPSGGDPQLRHLVHFRLTHAATSEQWWAVTPDGGGLCWRCRWIGLHGPDQVHPHQQGWVDLLRTHLADSASAQDPQPWPVASAQAWPPKSEETFWAPPLWGGLRFRTWWVEAGRRDHPEPSRVRVVCVTESAKVILVSEGPDGPWSLPGGGREAGETTEQALIREVQEESCAQVLHSAYLGCLVGAAVTGSGLGERWAQAAFLATVRTEDWEPRFEIRHRRLVEPSEVLRALTTWTPTSLAWVAQALAAIRFGSR